MSDINMSAVKYKLKNLRNRFYDAGDDDGVLMCDNLADDLGIGNSVDPVEPEAEDDQDE